MRSLNLDRGALWKVLGEPADQEGSVNDPRTHEEYGAVWNEKWIYRGEDGRSVARVALWNRYDLVGVFDLRPDGSAEPVSLAGTDACAPEITSRDGTGDPAKRDRS